MSDQEKEPKFMIGFEGDRAIRADGKAEISGTVMHTDNVSAEEIRETAAEAYGVSPDSVTIPNFDGKPYDGVQNQRSRRLSIGFLASRWNSPWNPGEDKSNLN